MTQEEFANLHEKLEPILLERLKKGKMVPFYKINDKMRKWMSKNKIREVRRNEWHLRWGRDEKPEGHVGMCFRADPKATSSCRSMNPNWFYLELPVDLVLKALVFGEFP